MNHFLWMHPWDLEGWDPHEFLDELDSAGIDEVRLALAYHGGRMLLPRNRRYLVYEQHDGAVYFEPDAKGYGLLQPERGRHIDAVLAFLKAAAKRSFRVRAWLVLCHNDRLGRLHPELCIRNYRDEPYTYALCPAQPEVQDYIVALIKNVSRLPGLTGLDLEALSFMGYEHNSLHDKRAVPIDSRLNVCHCSICRGACDRVSVIADLLERVCSATRLPLDLRYTSDSHFAGGKTYLPQELLAGRVASITRTYFGKPSLEVHCDAVPSNAGFQFHPPDTQSLEQLAERYRQASSASGVGFYCYGLASDQHWGWLKQVLQTHGAQ